jgi:ribosome biogenesis GTPase
LLESYGWSDELSHQFESLALDDVVPARVTVQQRGLYTLAAERGELTAELGGRFAFEAGEGEYPVVGDWVALTVPTEGRGTIHAVLPRRTAFVRRAAGDAGAAQVLAANIDTVFLVSSLNADLSLRRLERYLASAWESGADPVVVLTKADLPDAVEARLVDVQSVASGVPVHAVSAVTGEGLDGLRSYLGPGRTGVLLGSSGVGKSTLVNALAGEELLATAPVREADARGRHTTTHRELVLLPGGGLVLDTPGMRELGLWDAEAGLDTAFADVDELFGGCRFADCAHEREPGCAIRAALADGTLRPERWESYVKLQREAAYAERKGDPRATAAERKKWIARGKEWRTTVW